MDEKHYQAVKEKYGKHASWAVWDISWNDYRAILEKINPLIIALGRDAFRILERNKLNELYNISELIWIIHPAYHYKGCSNPEIYRQKVWEMIKTQLPKGNL